MTSLAFDSGNHYSVVSSFLNEPAITYRRYLPFESSEILTFVFTEKHVGQWDYLLIIMISLISSTVLFFDKEAMKEGWSVSVAPMPGLLISILIISTVIAVLESLVLILILWLLLQLLGAIASILQG